MSSKKQDSGGIHFGDVAGNVSMKAGGDIVAGDKTTTTTIQHGFRSEGDKQEFQTQLEELREALGQIKSHVEATRGLSADEKDELSGEILERVKALKEIKEMTAEIPAGRKPTADIVKTVEADLDKANGILEKVQAVGKKSAELAANVGEFP